MGVITMNEKRETRKVIQAGNSLGISLPKAIIDSLNINRGDELEFDISEGKIILKKKQKLEDRIDPELLDVISEALDEHDELFKRLKDR